MTNELRERYEKDAQTLTYPEFVDKVYKIPNQGNKLKDKERALIEEFHKEFSGARQFWKFLRRN